MISFKQFLLEDEQDPIDLIRRDCKPFLDIWEGRALVRGMRKIPRSHQVGEINHPYTDSRKIGVFKTSIRKDRQPADTSPEVHNALNNWFKEKFGVKARSEALFCYGENNITQAGEYGKLYTVFPIGKFKIIWAPNITDLSVSVDYGNNRKIILNSGAEDVLGNYNFTDTNVESALKSRAELMLICYEYYAFEYAGLDEIKNQL